MTVHKTKTIITGIVILSIILTAFSKCGQQEQKVTQKCIDEITIINYLVEQNYNITTTNRDSTHFTIKCKK